VGFRDLSTAATDYGQHWTSLMMWLCIIPCKTRNFLYCDLNRTYNCFQIHVYFLFCHNLISLHTLPWFPEQSLLSQSLNDQLNFRVEISLYNRICLSVCILVKCIVKVLNCIYLAKITIQVLFLIRIRKIYSPRWEHTGTVWALSDQNLRIVRSWSWLNWCCSLEVDLGNLETYLLVDWADAVAFWCTRECGQHVC